MITIGTGVLFQAISKTKMVVIFPNQTGLIYEVSELTNEAFSDPDSFISKNNLKPLFKLGWSPKENGGKGGAVSYALPGQKQDVAGMTLKEKISPMLKKVTSVYDLFTFFDKGDLRVIAMDNLIKLYDFTEQQASGSADLFLAQLENDARLRLNKAFNPEYELNFKAQLPPTKTEDTKELKSANPVEEKAVATTKKGKK